MRLIDADAFDKCLANAQIECKKGSGNVRWGILNQVRGNLAQQPTIEAEPVRREKKVSNIGERIEKFGFHLFIIAGSVILPPLIIYVIYLIGKEILGG